MPSDALHVGLGEATRLKALADVIPLAPLRYRYPSGTPYIQPLTSRWRMRQGGSASPAVRVEANPMQLSAFGIGLESVRTTLGVVNQNMATGYFRNDRRISDINTNDQLFLASEYAPLVVGYNPATGAAVL